MARVYEARSRANGRRVAFKVLDAAMDPVRFEREARVLASIDHPAIVRYVAHGTRDGKSWLATEWLEGEDLATRMEKRWLELDEILGIARAACGALAYLHAHGIVHRDVKPANIFLAGPTPRVRLLDFGIARDHSLSPLTAAHSIMGTPQYMPPEQAIDARKADARADVFALGAVIFEAATLVLPEPVQRFPGVPAALHQLLARMLAPSPGDRPTAQAVHDEASRLAELFTGSDAGIEEVEVELVDISRTQSPTQALGWMPDCIVTLAGETLGTQPRRRGP